MDLGSLGFVVDSEKLYQEKVEAEAKVTKRNFVENGSNIQSPWRKRKKLNSGEYFWSLNWIQVGKLTPM